MLRYFLTIGGVQFSSYGLMLVISFWVGGYLVQKRATSLGMNSIWIISTSVVMMVLGILGSRFLYLLVERRSEFFERPSLFFQFSNGGLSFAGGYLLAVAFGFWRCRRDRVSFLTLMDIIMPSVCLGLAITKIGCFLAGCCYGRSCSLPWAVTYTEAQTASGFVHVPIHPSQLYESFMAFVVFWLLRLIWKNRKFEGQVFLSFLMFYGSFRFLLEFTRGSEPLNRFGISPSQEIFAALVLLAAMFWPVAKYRKN